MMNIKKVILFIAHKVRRETELFFVHFSVVVGNPMLYCNQKLLIFSLIETKIWEKM